MHAAGFEDLVPRVIRRCNLATFVTNLDGSLEAQRIIAENLHRNFIDHAEYPRYAPRSSKRCIRMIADPSHAPGRRPARGPRARRRRSCSAASP